MKGIFSKRTINLLAFLLILVLVSSCNRGYGCPTNFSLQDDLIEMAIRALSLFI